MYYGTKGQIELLKHVLDNGYIIENKRTNSETKAIFDAKVVFKDGEMPLWTDYLTSPRLAFEEMWFFLRGETDTSKLEEKGCYFWTGNTTREFLDKVGLTEFPEKYMGAAYSNQFRNSGGFVNGNGVDQLVRLINGLKNDEFGRRHVIDLWNPMEEEFMPITPCWLMSKYSVIPKNGKKYLNVKLTNRSLDILFGFRYAVMNYRLFQIALCKMFNYELGELVCDITNAHIYENQYERAKEVCEREFLDYNGSIVLKKDIKNLNDLLNLEWEDWELDYKYNKSKFVTERPVMVA